MTIQSLDADMRKRELRDQLKTTASEQKLRVEFERVLLPETRHSFNMAFQEAQVSSCC